MAIDVTAKSATAVAYDTAANADAYFLARGITTWTGADSVKEEALIRGADYLDRTYAKKWLGVKTTQAQSLDWPRSWLDDLDGYPVDADTIPVNIKNANFEAALLVLTGTELEPVLARGGSVTRKSVKAGPVATQTEYSSGAPARSTLTTIEGLLTGLVSQGSTQPLLRV
jgi:hypothetical protein